VRQITSKSQGRTPREDGRFGRVLLPMFPVVIAGLSNPESLGCVNQQ
jgi:hypothetical protein